MRILALVLCFGFFAFGIAGGIQAQDKAISKAPASPESSDRAQDGLIGPVRRVRVETAKIMVKGGKIVESPRLLQAITTYDQLGRKIDSVAYPVAGSSLAGKEQYRYDDKGNIIEMTLRSDDGSVLSKENYQYEFDELGNWKKMTSSIAVYENGNLGWEPIEVTYRAMTYYYGQAVAVMAAPTGNPVSSTTPVATDRGSTKTEKSKIQQHAGVDEPKTATSGEAKASNPEELASSKTDKSDEPPAETAAVTAKDEPPKLEEAPELPVINVPEEALRKAAIELWQPEYPAAAMNAGIEGKVEVQFIIDEKGMVETVRAVSGNPLLQEAAASAARRARFIVSGLSSQPAKIFGVITYEFALPQRETTPEPPVMSSTGDSKLAATIEGSKPAATTEETTMPREMAVAVPPESKPPAKEDTATPTGISVSPGATPATGTNTQPVPPPAFGTPFEKGMASLAAARYAAAVKYFEEVIRADPKDALAYCKLGLAHSVMNEHKEAVAAFKEAIRLKRAFVDADSFYRMGNAYIALGEHATAVEPLKQSLYMLRAQGLDPEQRKPVPGTPRQLEVHYALGLAYFGSNSFRDAAREFENAIRLKQDFASAHYGLGLSYAAFGDKASAQKEEQILRSLKSPLAIKLANALFMPGVQKRTVF